MQCLHFRFLMRRKLFKDPDFPANNYSYSRRTDGRQKPPKGMVWKRTSEIRDRNPKFIASGYDQFDVDQGTNIYFFRKFLFIYLYFFAILKMFSIFFSGKFLAAYILLQQNLFPQGPPRKEEAKPPQKRANLA